MAFIVSCILAIREEKKISSGKTEVTPYMNKYNNKSRFKNMNHCQPRQEKNTLKYEKYICNFRYFHIFLFGFMFHLFIYLLAYWLLYNGVVIYIWVSAPILSYLNSCS